MSLRTTTPNSSRVASTPWTLDDVDHLRIVCNHDSVKTIEPSITTTIEAIWRAFHFREWDDFEWEPIAVEWQKIAVVHQVRGHCLNPSLGSLHTDTLFLNPDKFEIRDYHRALLPIDKIYFLGGGFSLWGTPLLNATFTFNEDIMLLIATIGRLAPLMEVLGIEPDDATIETAITKFAKELDSVLLMAQQNKADLEQLLRLDASDYATQMADALDRICDIWLVDFDMSDFDRIFEQLSNRLEGVEATREEFGVVVLKLIEYSIQD